MNPKTAGNVTDLAHCYADLINTSSDYPWFCLILLNNWLFPNLSLIPYMLAVCLELQQNAILSIKIFLTAVTFFSLYKTKITRKKV